MSRISSLAKSLSDAGKIVDRGGVRNFMDGISYEFNPLTTMKMLTAASIFAEPQYYRSNKSSARVTASILPARVGEIIIEGVLPSKYLVFKPQEGKTVEDVMLNAIDSALDYDFGATIDWAVELRNVYNMRLNPQMIMVMAAKHSKRVEFEHNNAGVFRKVNEQVLRRADESATQLSCYLYLNKGRKNNLPNVLKRSWKKHLESLSKYAVAKYKNADLGMINVVRLCHANNPIIDELMTTGNVKIDETEKTWENLRSAGMSFKQIVQEIDLGHMALLRNLRNIFEELTDKDFALASATLQNLKNGVLGGKQFPFRYYSAYRMIEKADLALGGLVLDALDECIDISIDNMPKLSGHTACLSDNSGSAWGTLTSEYGSVRVAEINNLSGMLICSNSDVGSMFSFGDKLIKHQFRKRVGVLHQANKISEGRGKREGASTENGIWLFFEQAIKEKTHYDNIFIFSDQQAGHGGLYGLSSDYSIGGTRYSHKRNNRYIDVMKLLETYRKTVNPKVNFFTVQTAGYDNALIPEYTYRGAVLYGWTGKEAVFANEIINQWNAIEHISQQPQRNN